MVSVKVTFEIVPDNPETKRFDGYGMAGGLAPESEIVIPPGFVNTVPPPLITVGVFTVWLILPLLVANVALPT